MLLLRVALEDLRRVLWSVSLAFSFQPGWVEQEEGTWEQRAQFLDFLEGLASWRVGS